jgi:hypothetical protein
MTKQKTSLIKGSTSAGLLFGVVLGTLVTLYITMRTPATPRVPTRQETKVDNISLENEIILDLDKDGRADLIVGKGSDDWVRFYKPGFERKTSYKVFPNFSLQMSSNLEETATTMLKVGSELKYQEAKARYDTKKDKK